LEAVARAARAGENVIPPLLDAVRADATVGEICDVWRRVYGAYAGARVV
jgi:methylmalonyl-CoA mutase N-terminal domain/subunit